ncbi:tRNA ligase [Mycena sanguinolenta]|uniref:tRNA ligase n=1 Tax=Mycena sanguinolenta TaxID=230812 RepID=A0A8H7CNJ1_9AGAR|nr:tRNA ligase [Mycena sanguinolenta]
MMARPTAAEDSALIQELMDLSSAKPKLVRASNYAAPVDPNISIASWKMAEHKYYMVPSPFPTLARGVFSLKQSDGRYRIVARGYDKFFNIGEVGWTTWPALEAHTTAPYTLSLKSNGCIIFIAALTPEKLLVTSKHAVGPAKGEKKLSHADAGETWLRKYLAEKGRTEADLARVLWENNWTAVAELCDDSFEEHVLAYPPETTGLHLHGLNESTKAFKTQPHAVVDAFAEEWGFIKTASMELSTISAVREFTTEIGKTGAWNGVPVEGFVVRTQVSAPSTPSSSRSAPPYPPGSSFFFKVKFDEPYMMYRDWREVTKMLLSMRSNAKGKGKDGMSIEALPKTKMRRAETKVYARWVVEEIQRDPAAFAEYNENKGIVAVRERFLAYLAGEKGKKALKANPSEKAEERAPETTQAKSFKQTIIVPVAIPGCGKTAVAVALSHLFGFGHTQSDDVKAKKPAPVFIKNVTDLLKRHDVVIADKNNHLKQHRQALRDANPGVRLLALNWPIDEQPPAAMHRVCADRIQARGANHQTLRPNDAGLHEDVLWTFLNNAEPLAPNEVDEIVEMSLADGLEDTVRRAIDECVHVLGVKQPTEMEVEAALDRARGYAVDEKAKRADSPPPAGKEKKHYFAFLPEVALEPLLEPVLADVSFWGALREAGRVAKRPHVTLVHWRALESPGEDAATTKAFWARCKALCEMGQAPLFQMRLGHVVWNERVMAVTVDGVELVEADVSRQAGAEFVAQLPEKVKGRLHITVGTAGDAQPVEAKALVEAWWKDADTAKSIPLGGVVTTATVKKLY